jgi:hypothetical protein
MDMWEPPTKQFSFIHMSYGDLSAILSVLRPAEPTSIGPRPASWQRIRDGHPERQESEGTSPVSSYIEWTEHTIRK